MKFIIIIIISLFFIGCKPDKENKIIVTKNKSNIIHNKLNKNKISIDRNLTKKSEIAFLTISNGTDIDSISTICSCQKNKIENAIFIQLRTNIPTKKQIKSGLKSRYNTTEDNLHGQFKFLTIKLKDSLVHNIEIYSKSTDKDYDGKYFESLTINNYDIKISTFDYSVASNVYGKFKMTLPKDFGYFKNDTIIKGYFKCNNWIISTKEEIQKWKINTKFPKSIE